MNSLILAAAGSGLRFGGEIPKQFTLLANRPLYQHSLVTLAPLCGHVVVVVPTDWVTRVGRDLEGLLPKLGAQVQVVPGGETRQESVWRGIQSLPAREGVVLVHDAARPFVSRQLGQRVLSAAAKVGACIPGVPVHDTIKQVHESRVTQTLDRACLRAIQTPQGFHLSLLKRAFEKAIKEGFQGNDEATLVERLDEPVEVVSGEWENLKVTRPEDLDPAGPV